MCQRQAQLHFYTSQMSLRLSVLALSSYQLLPSTPFPCFSDRVLWGGEDPKATGGNDFSGHS